MSAALALQEPYHVKCRHCGWPVATRMPNGWLDPHGLVTADDRDNLVIACPNPQCDGRERIRKTRLVGQEPNRT